MAGLGILRPDEVIFYHPLDNFTEDTKGQVWTGSTGFTPGKIGNADSAVAADAFTFGANNVASSAAVDTEMIDVLAMDSTSIVVSWRSAASSVFVKAGTVNGTDVTFGPQVSPRIGLKGSMTKLDSTKFVIGMVAQVGGGSVFAFVGTVSGTNVTFGAEAQFGGTSDALVNSLSLAALSPTKFVAHWTQPSTPGVLAIVGSVTGTSIAMGSFIIVSATLGSTAAIGLTASTALLANIESGAMKMHVATVSGLDITVGPDTAPTNTSTFLFAHSITALSETSVVVFHAAPAKVNAGTVSGTSVTWGADTGIAGVLVFPGWAFGITRMGATTFAVVSPDSAGPFLTRVRIGTVVGNSVSLNSSSLISATLGSHWPEIVRLTATTAAIAHNDGSDLIVNIASLDLLASLTASDPGAYPSAIGNDRLVVAMWGNKVGAGSSVVTIQRDFTVLLDATSISLGPATAVWSNAAVGTLMGTTMAGGEHLLILDFVNTGGGNWTLSTSLDGQAFVSHGAQTSGARTITPATLTPGIFIASGVAGQWVDETVMWAGSQAAFTQFTTQELANISDLADIFGEPMNQFEENFGAPLCWQATAKMPDGSVWRDSGSGSCPPVVRVPKGASDIVVTDNSSRVSPRIIEG